MVWEIGFLIFFRVLKDYFLPLVFYFLYAISLIHFNISLTDPLIVPSLYIAKKTVQKKPIK